MPRNNAARNHNPEQSREMGQEMPEKAPSGNTERPKLELVKEAPEAEKSLEVGATVWRLSATGKETAWEIRAINEQREVTMVSSGAKERWAMKVPEAEIQMEARLLDRVEQLRPGFDTALDAVLASMAKDGDREPLRKSLNRMKGEILLAASTGNKDTAQGLAEEIAKAIDDERKIESMDMQDRLDHNYQLAQQRAHLFETLVDQQEHTMNEPTTSEAMEKTIDGLFEIGREKSQADEAVGIPHVFEHDTVELLPEERTLNITVAEGKGDVRETMKRLRQDLEIGKADLANPVISRATKAELLGLMAQDEQELARLEMGLTLKAPPEKIDVKQSPGYQVYATLLKSKSGEDRDEFTMTLEKRANDPGTSIELRLAAQQALADYGDGERTPTLNTESKKKPVATKPGLLSRFTSWLNR